ncbi:Wadjet anti-phage system protein JetD domain-containing protein [Desulfosediminicola ganghwensis]|uniref:Wadjet anti-phage system protein JetD domain-containing protein n=1 Tax=Desulfosediminicola ganghwensis TaxID=2569540 RepID=UPI0010AC6D55|nr:Wadjet anti-phage system protein JetD domain-containing protein [Desulfosediminicola ganghwensis]
MRVLAKILNTLEAEGSIAFSKVSLKNRQKLTRLIETEIVRIDYTGAGKKYVTQDSKSLASYSLSIFPEGLDKAIVGTENRIDATAVYRNSKQGFDKQKTSVVLIRVFSPHPTVLRLNGQQLPAYEWCNLTGCAAITLVEGDRLEVNGNLATVENRTVFLNFDDIDTLETKIDMIIWTQGRFSRKVIDSIFVNSGCRFLHFGDYDPVGIDEYLKLKELNSRVELFVPHNLEALFKYGSEQLLNDSRTVYERLRSSEDPQARKVVELMSQYNRGLEHEALLIK